MDKRSIKRDMKNMLCPYCKFNKCKSSHHIIPRKYNGSDDKENLINLCFVCHDIVEIKTDNFIQSGKFYDIHILKNMILNDSFPLI